MKRLIKKAEINLSKFLISHLQHNNSTQSQIQEVINENSDCLYSGTGYRAFLFDEEEIIEALSEFLEEINETEVDFNSLPYYVNNTMDKLIRVDGTYQSFSRSFKAADTTIQYLNENKHIAIIIGCNIKDGLDIDKLSNKYKSSLSPEALEVCDFFTFQEEVVAKFDDTEFFVPEAGHLRYIFQKANR